MDPDLLMAGSSQAEGKGKVKGHLMHSEHTVNIKQYCKDIIRLFNKLLFTDNLPLKWPAFHKPV